MDKKESLKHELIEKWSLLNNAGNTTSRVKIILNEIEQLAAQLCGKESVEYEQLEKAKMEYEKAVDSPLNFAIALITPNIFFDDFKKNFEPIYKKIIQNHETLEIFSDIIPVTGVNDMDKKSELIKELETFKVDLVNYYNTRIKMKQKRFSQKEINEVLTLRQSLVNRSGKYKALIAETTGIEQVPIILNGKEYVTDIWSVGLLANPVQRTQIALNYCVDSVEQTIGYLETKANNEAYNVRGNNNLSTVGNSPKAFIVHGGQSGVLDKLCDFIDALGIIPLVVEMLPSKGMTVADKVKKYQKEADCAIILATRGGIIDTKSGKQHPRLNVVDELSSFWEAFPEKIILLLEKGATLHSNKAGLTYEPFTRQSMDRAFIAIARELKEMKILKAEKPPKL